MTSLNTHIERASGTDTACLDATWAVIDPNDLDAGGTMLVRDAHDVDHLVEALSQPEASAALIHHHGRPSVEFEGELMPDHEVRAAVQGEYGYLTWSDEDLGYAVSEGKPESPACLADYAEYAAGTGVDLATFRAALIEFLTTGQRPTCLAWRNLP
jgi:hypothetical protein